MKPNSNFLLEMKSTNQRDRALAKIKEEKEEKAKQKVTEKYAQKIVHSLKKYTRKEKGIRDLLKSTETKLGDIENLAKLMEKRNQAFKLPFQHVLNLTMSLHKAFMHYFKKMSYLAARSGKGKQSVQKFKTEFKPYLLCLEKLLIQVMKSCDDPNSENLYNSTFNYETMFVKEDIKTWRSALNFKRLFLMTFMALELGNTYSELYSSSTQKICLKFLLLFLSPETYLKFSSCKSDLNLKILYKLLIETSLAYPHIAEKSVLLKSKTISKLLGALLRSQISYKKEFSYDEIIFNTLEVSVSLFHIYTIANSHKKLPKVHEQVQYDYYLHFQSEFLLNILSIPRISKFILLYMGRTPTNVKFSEMKMQIESKCEYSDILINTHWKDIFQSFLYINFNDPFNPNLKELFVNRFQDSKSLFYFLIGNTVDLLFEIFIHLPASDLFSLLSVLNLSFSFITGAWLETLFFTGTTDLDYLLLRNQFECLFDRNHVTQLFLRIADVKPSTKGKQPSNMMEEEIKIDTSSKGKKGVVKKDIIVVSKAEFSDEFQPNLFSLLCEFYASVLSACYQGEHTQALISGAVNSLAFDSSFIRRLWLFIKMFQDIDAVSLHHTYLMGKQSLLSSLVIFSMLYYNHLLITDAEDFAVNNVFSGEEIKSMLKLLLNIIIDLNWNMATTVSNRTAAFLAYQGARLLKQLYEFNQEKELLPKKQWLLEASKIKEILKEAALDKSRGGYLVKRLPFTIPFETRLQIFKNQIQYEKSLYPAAYRITIRRNNLFEDGFNAFNDSKINLKSRIQVVFVDEFGNYEDGIDGGGLFKEFLTELSSLVFNPEYGLFKVAEKDATLYPNPESATFYGPDHIPAYYFVGLVLGRSLYDNILISCEFSHFFLRTMLGKMNYLNELQSLDPDLFHNLKFLKNYEGDVKDLCLTFSVSDSGNTGKEIDLIPNGREIAVTNENKFKYIYCMANHKLNTEIKNQCKAFMAGLTKVIPLEWIQIFDEKELQIAMSGTRQPIDVQDLKKHTVYKGYFSWDGYIKDFWKLVESFNDTEKELLIKFVTSCSRPPILGFETLNPPFTIQCVDSEKDTKLPTASTCFNTLKLPKYSNAKKLKEKLLTAITSGAGFHLA